LSAASVEQGAFAAKLIAWHVCHGRHDLPWQTARDPYSIWVSEIMLQQTQVATVIPYYRRFMERFPHLADLAAAPLDHVLAVWAGLGYYSRARNLHRAAQRIMREHDGRFPQDFEVVRALPGIGRSTAAAICAFAFGACRAILDGNVKRVLARHFGIRGYPGARRVELRLWRRAESLLPQTGVAAYTQAIMDLGATVCLSRSPRCGACPLNADCVARGSGLTARIPAPRPRKSLPRRETVMLALEHAGEVLLEKRPPSGIWGGLWCLPEAGRSRNLRRFCEERFGARIGSAKPLAAVEHGFTHFRLTIRPQHLRIARLEPGVCEPGHLWLPLEDAVGAALPAPVKRILLNLAAARATMAKG
jgi:A/G-specific adenine glycosylase